MSLAADWEVGRNHVAEGERRGAPSPRVKGYFSQIADRVAEDGSVILFLDVSAPET